MKSNSPPYEYGTALVAYLFLPQRNVAEVMPHSHCGYITEADTASRTLTLGTQMPRYEEAQAPWRGYVKCSS